MIKVFRYTVLFLSVVFLLNTPSYADEINHNSCELFTQTGMDDWINWTVEKVFNTGFLSDEINDDLKESLIEKGYTLSPKNISFNSLGLIPLQNQNQFAINKQGDDLKIYFKIKDYDEKLLTLHFEYKTGSIPSCQSLKERVNRFKESRFFLLEANENTNLSWGKSIMSLENAEFIIQSRGKNKNEWQTYQRKYLTLLNRIKEKIEETEDSFNVLEIVRYELLSSGMSSYNREQTTIIGFLDGEGVNCVARTMLFLSIIKDLDIKVPEGYEYGVEAFSDHIQPVIVNLNEGHSIDLIASKLSPELTNPIVNIDFVLSSAFDKYETFYLRKDNFVKPYQNVNKFVFLPEDMSNSVVIGTGYNYSEEDVNRVDVLSLNLPTTAKFFEGEIPKSANESYLSQENYRLNRGDFTNGAGESNGNGNAEAVSDSIDITKPYFSLDQIRESPSMSDRIKSDYINMVERGYFTESDLDNYGLKNIAHLFPDGLPEEHLKSVFPPVYYRKGWVGDIYVYLGRDYIMDFEVDGEFVEDLRDLKSVAPYQVYTDNLAHMIFRANKSLAFLRQNYETINTLSPRLENIDQFFEYARHFSILGKHIKSVCLRNYISSAFRIKDLKCEDFMKHNGLVVEEEEYFKLFDLLGTYFYDFYKYYEPKLHDLVLGINEFESDQQVLDFFKSIDQDLAQILSSGYHKLYYDNELDYRDNYGEEFSEVIKITSFKLRRTLRKYILRSKNFFYSSKDLSETGVFQKSLNSNTGSSDIVRTDVNLPRINLNEDACKNQNENGYAQSGLFIVDCSRFNESIRKQSQSVFTRTAYPINPTILLELFTDIGTYNWNYHDLLLLNTMWTDEFTNKLAELERETEKNLMSDGSRSNKWEKLRVLLRFTKQILEAPWLSYNYSEKDFTYPPSLNSCYDNSDPETFKNCIYDVSFVQISEIGTSVWLKNQPFMQPLHDYFYEVKNPVFYNEFKTFDLTRDENNLFQVIDENLSDNIRDIIIDSNFGYDYGGGVARLYKLFSYTGSVHSDRFVFRDGNNHYYLSLAAYKDENGEILFFNKPTTIDPRDSLNHNIIESNEVLEQILF